MCVFECHTCVSGFYAWLTHMVVQIPHICSLSHTYVSPVLHMFVVLSHMFVIRISVDKHTQISVSHMCDFRIHAYVSRFCVCLTHMIVLMSHMCGVFLHMVVTYDCTIWLHDCPYDCRICVSWMSHMCVISPRMVVIYDCTIVTHVCHFFYEWLSHMIVLLSHMCFALYTWLSRMIV